MNKILILSRRDSRESYDQKDTYLKNLPIADSRATYVVDEFENLLFHYDGSELRVTLGVDGEDIRSFDTVFFIAWFKTKILEDIALSAALYLKSHHVTVLNTEVLYTRSRSKLSQYVIAAIHDISITPFQFSMDPGVLKQAIATRWSHGYPVIMKGVQASRGKDNYLIDDDSAAYELLDKLDNEVGPWYVVQTFVPNDGDYRIIVMGDSVVSVIHRQSQTDSHLNNTSQGGEASLLDVSTLPKSVFDQSVHLSKLLRREITGVDMICHRETGVYYLLEINNMPQLATGSFVPHKMRLLDSYLSSLSEDHID